MKLVIVRSGSEPDTSKAEVWEEKIEIGNLIGGRATVILRR